MNRVWNVLQLQTLVLLLLLSAAGPVAAGFAGGDGSATDPWQIATARQLNEIRHDLTAHYILINDIDLARATGNPAGTFWNNGAGWEPIASTRASSFRGSLDGNSFAITGLFIDRSGGEQAGLFGWTGFGAVLKRLALEAVDINGGSLVGGLVVTNFGATVENSYVTGNVIGTSFVGGLVGRNLSGTITNSYVAGTVQGRNFVGGLAGSNWGRVMNSYAAGSVRGDTDVGGLVGASSRTVSNSYWNTQASGLTHSSGGGIGLNSAEMRQQSSFRGFDFDGIWQIRESAAFPVLKGNPQDPPPMDIAAPDSHTSTLRNAGSELSKTLSITGTGVFNRVRVSGVVDSIRLPETFKPGSTRPGRGIDEITIVSDEARATVFPYEVRQTLPGQETGLFLNDDGDLVLVTADRLEVSSHPVVADRKVLDRALEQLDLHLEYGERATMRLLPADSAGYFSARADILAIQAPTEKEEGLFFRPVPGLQGASQAYLVFTDESGIPMQQELAPVPADWPAMKNGLAAMEGISEVRKDPQGIISVAVDGQTVRGRMEYDVTRTPADTGEAGESAVLISVGDVNGDGTEDFRVLYPGGDRQLLLIIP